ncbi:hypothetical protein [Amycolatopsis sp. MJM2582]|uniref:hypothetical protein n=1 Tax=Amycolatopsis sp. MJM2582 TaxID=1427749 RepID=UPI000561D9BA|nr:hypothetical protein [Amycolatopsis sp. MJM2582]
MSDALRTRSSWSWARQVADSPEFRRARYALRRSVAEELPALADLRKDPATGPWMISSVSRAADELVRELAAERADLLQAGAEALQDHAARNTAIRASSSAMVGSASLRLEPELVDDVPALAAGDPDTGIGHGLRWAVRVVDDPNGGRAFARMIQLVE